MSIFDSISGTISSLFDGDVGGAWDNLSNSSADSWFSAAGGAVKGYDALQNSSKQQAANSRSVYDFIERNSRMADINEVGKFASHPNKQYGAGNFSVDPRDITREWASYLQGVADPSTVPGKLYKAGGAN